MWSHDEDGNLIYVFHNAEYDHGTYGGRDAQVRRVHWSNEGMPILDMQTDEELNPAYADVNNAYNDGVTSCGIRLSETEEQCRRIRRTNMV